MPKPQHLQQAIASERPSHVALRARRRMHSYLHPNRSPTKIGQLCRQVGDLHEGYSASGHRPRGFWAYQTFKKALSTGNPADFAAITVGGTRTENDPQGGLAFNLDFLDSAQFTSPQAPAVASEDYAGSLWN